jgi:DNA-binding CsgD family transcriptional regulator
VIGRSFDFDLLTAVTESDPEEVDACLRQLRSLHLIQAGGTTDTFDFRHALIRDALYAEIPLPRRRLLHARVALVAGSRGYRSAFVSAHYDQAQLSAPAYRHALLAAQEAAAVSAHREALELYRRALRNLSPDAGPQEQAGLLAALGAEAAAVDENAAAADAFARAHALWLEAGDCLSAAAIVPGLVSARHLLGEGLDTRVRRLEEELEALHGVPGADPVNALLLGALSAAYLVNDGLDDAIFYGEQSRKLSHATGNEEVELNTAATLGSVLVFAGQMEAGWALLENAIGRSVTLEHEAEAGRGYRLIGSSASALVEYDRAELWLNRGIAYSETAELWNHHSYMATHLAHVQWASGQWDEAQRTAEHALADGRGGITTQNTALYVLGYLAIGRGDYDKGIEFLTEAIDLGESMAELQRISPPLWGLAEAALLNGDFDRAVGLSERGYAASEQVADAAYLFPFLVTGLRARLALDDPAGAAEWLARVEVALRRRNVPGTLPAIAHARGLLQLESGDLGAAAESLESARAGWLEHRRFWEGTWVLLDQARCAFRAKRFAAAAALSETTRNLAETVGAAALVAAVEALQQEQRAQPEQPWHPLTAREYDVAALVAAGLTNREIAARLFLAPKTVSAHVEHILTKLGAGRRAEIAAWAARIDG